MYPKRQSIPGATTMPTQVRQFVSKHELAIAAYAWDCFRMAGKGIVMIDMVDRLERESLNDMQFVSRQDLEASNTAGVFTNALRMIAAYDPGREAVVAVLLPGQVYTFRAEFSQEMPALFDKYKQGIEAMVKEGHLLTLSFAAPSLIQ